MQACPLTSLAAPSPKGGERSTREASVPTASTSTSQVLSEALACGGYIPGYPNDQSCGLARMGDRPLAEEYRQRSPTHTAPRPRPTHSHVELVIRSLTGPALTSPLCGSEDPWTRRQDFSPPTHFGLSGKMPAPTEGSTARQALDILRPTLHPLHSFSSFLFLSLRSALSLRRAVAPSRVREGCLLCILPAWPLPDCIRTKPDVIRVRAYF